MSQPSEFHFFPELPAEIRYHIWRLVPQPTRLVCHTVRRFGGSAARSGSSSGSSSGASPAGWYDRDLHTLSAYRPRLLAAAAAATVLDIAEDGQDRQDGEHDGRNKEIGGPASTSTAQKEEEEEEEEDTGDPEASWRVRWVVHPAHLAVPPLLRACRESRAAWLPAYCRPLRWSHGGWAKYQCPYVNYETDIFVWGEVPCGRADAPYGFDGARVQHAAMYQRPQPQINGDDRRAQRGGVLVGRGDASEPATATARRWGASPRLLPVFIENMPNLVSITLLVSGPDMDIGACDCCSGPSAAGRDSSSCSSSPSSSSPSYGPHPQHHYHHNHRSENRLIHYRPVGGPGPSRKVHPVRLFDRSKVSELWSSYFRELQPEVERPEDFIVLTFSAVAAVSAAAADEEDGVSVNPWRLPEGDGDG